MLDPSGLDISLVVVRMLSLPREPLHSLPDGQHTSCRCREPSMHQTCQYSTGKATSPEQPYSFVPVCYCLTFSCVARLQRQLYLSCACRAITKLPAHHTTFQGDSESHLPTLDSIELRTHFHRRCASFCIACFTFTLKYTVHQQLLELD